MLANVQQTTIKPIITGAVARGTLVHTDEYNVYARLLAWGLPRAIQFWHIGLCVSGGGVT